MGVNKPDVRYVVHFSMPKSSPTTTRRAAAGDGLGAKCVLYFVEGPRDARGDDPRRHGPPRRQVPRRRRERAQGPPGHGALRRGEGRVPAKDDIGVLGERGFDPAVGCGELCDNCVCDRAPDTRDAGAHASALLAILDGVAGARLTLSSLGDVFRGSNSAAVRKLGLANARGFGQGKGLAKDDAEDLIGRLICAGVLKEVAIETGAGFNADYVFSGDGAAPYRGRNAPPFEYAVRSRAKKRASPRGARAAGPAAAAALNAAARGAPRRKPAARKRAPDVITHDAAALKARIFEWRAGAGEHNNVLPFQVISEEHINVISAAAPTTTERCGTSSTLGNAPTLSSSRGRRGVEDRVDVREERVRDGRRGLGLVRGAVRGAAWSSRRRKGAPASSAAPATSSLHSENAPANSRSARPFAARVIAAQAASTAAQSSDVVVVAGGEASSGADIAAGALEASPSSCYGGLEASLSSRA
ncbi:DEAD-like helicase [Aureococcus anophagefferens]|nr:DEAD-like helicase [Aureococcus anophagefferens]